MSVDSDNGHMMNNNVRVFEATSGAYRAAIAVRDNPLSGRASLVASAPSLPEVMHRLRYERVITTVVVDHSADAADLRAVRDEFFAGLVAAVHSAELRIAEARAKADYWAAVEERKLAVPVEQRTEKDRRRIAEARRHGDRHRAFVSEHEGDVAAIERPWLG